MRQRTSGPYARAAPGSLMAATIRTDGSADFTAAARSAVNVAMPQRRGTEEATKAMRMTHFPSGRSFGGTLATHEGAVGESFIEGECPRSVYRYCDSSIGSPAFR